MPKTEKIKQEIQNLERTVEAKAVKQYELMKKVENIEQRLEQRDTNWSDGNEADRLRDHINCKIADGTYEDEEKELVNWLFEELKELRLTVEGVDKTNKRLDELEDRINSLEKRFTKYTDRESTCCAAPVQLFGKGDFHDSDRAVTMHYECTQCNRACDAE